MVSAVTSSAQHRPPPPYYHPDLHKPLIFPNHERKFKLFSWAVCGAIAFHMALFMDHGDREHCFSPLRRYCKRKLESFLVIQPEDEAYIQKRVEKLQRTVELVKEEQRKQQNV